MVFEAKSFMDKICKAYLLQLAEDPETIIPPGIALYYFERTAAGYPPLLPPRFPAIPGVPLTHEISGSDEASASPTGRMSTGGRGALAVDAVINKEFSTT